MSRIFLHLLLIRAILSRRCSCLIFVASWVRVNELGLVASLLLMTSALTSQVWTSTRKLVAYSASSCVEFQKRSPASQVKKALLTLARFDFLRRLLQEMLNRCRGGEGPPCDGQWTTYATAAVIVLSGVRKRRAVPAKRKFCSGTEGEEH